jgi:hypothetical protein
MMCFYRFLYKSKCCRLCSNAPLQQNVIVHMTVLDPPSDRMRASV